MSVTNSFINSNLVAKMSRVALAEFVMQQSFLVTGNRLLEGEFKQGYYEPGDTVNIRLQNKFTVSRGDSVSPEPILESTDSVVCQPLYSVPLEISTFDETLRLDDYNQRIIRPAIRELVSQIETDIATVAATQLWQAYGTPGSPINSFSSVDGAASYLVSRDIPESPLYLALRPKDATALKSSLQNAFNPILNQEISFGSRLGHLSEFDVFRNRGIIRQTAGTASTQTPVVTGGPVSSGTSITFTGLTANDANAFKAGDIIYFPDASSPATSVHSLTNLGRVDTGDPMTFVVQANQGTNSSGQATVSILPAINTTVGNPQQNVSNPIPNGARAVVYASSYRNVAYHETGLSVVTLPLKPLYTPYCENITDQETGITLRFSIGADVLNNLNIMRIDALVAYKWHGQYGLQFLS